MLTSESSQNGTHPRSQHLGNRWEQVHRPHAKPSSAWHYSRFAKLALQIIHSILILSLTVLAGHFAWTRVMTPALSGKETVTVVSDSVVRVYGLEDGIFKRDSSLQHGTYVKAGQMLGMIHSPNLERELDLLESKKSTLFSLLSQLDGHSDAFELKRHSLQQKIAENSDEILALRERISSLKIYTPTNGVILHGVANYQAVKPQETALVEIWNPDSDLLVEIESPLHDIINILNRDKIECELILPEGNVLIEAFPISSSLETFYREQQSGLRSVRWGRIKCRPSYLPAEAKRPGIIGRLQS